MRYLLDEEEMAAIRAERENMRKLPGGSDHLEALKNVCQMVATTMIPTDRTAFIGRTGRDKPYGCIHVNRHESYGYCDRCPVQGICPQPQEFSK